MFGKVLKISNIQHKKRPIKIGFNNHNHTPNHPDFQKFFATLKKETISAIRNAGGNNNDNTHHPDILDILNRKKIL